MTEDGPDGLHAQECRGDFWCRLEGALTQARGGPSIETLANMKLKDVVDLLAQNGIRMLYDNQFHIDKQPHTKL